jgi:hypothetical protein
VGLARFKVTGRFDKAGGAPISGTLIIDRKTGIVTVRPHRRRAVFRGTLDALAEMLVQRSISADVRRG